MQPGRARTSGLGVPFLPLARWVCWVARVCPTHGVLVLSCPPAALRACGVLGHLAPVHRCARSVCCFACAVSWASWLLFTGVPARCVVLRVRCPGPPGSCSPVCPLGVLCWVCGVLGLLAPVHRCARSVCCVVCAVSWASWLLFTGVPVPCVVSRVWRPGPPGSCSPVCPLGVLFCVCGVLDQLAPLHRCVRSVCCVGCAVSSASWLLFTGVPARCVVLGVRCPGPPGSCSPVCPLGALFRVCGVLGLLAPVHRCARSVCCGGCAVSWASWLLFTGVPARCVVLRVRCPGPLGSCSAVCLLGVLFCVCGVLGQLAPVHRCARSVCCVGCAVSWASWLLFTGVPARCVVLRVRCPGPPGSCSLVCPPCALFRVCSVLGHLALVHRCAARCVVLRVRCPGPPGSCSPVRLLSVLFCVCGVLDLLAPVHRCACSACCVGCASPGPPGSCSPVCPLGALLHVCGVLGHLAPVHRCARSVCCVAYAVSWASWLLFTGVPARCVVLRVRCPGPTGSCSPVCPLGVLCWVCGVLGFLAPVRRCARSLCCVACAVSWASWLLFNPCARSVRCFACAASWATWLLFTGVPLGVLFCVCGVLGPVAPVQRCARSVCCFACAVFWASWLLFTGVPARCVVLGVRCPGLPGSCSPVCPLGALFRVCGVLGHLAPVHRCARSVCCVACAVFWASWLLFTGVPARCVVLRVRCPGPPGSCSPVCPLGVLFCVCGVLGFLAPVHRCACSVCCVGCAVSWASWLLFSGVPAWCVVLRVRCPGPPGSCSPVRPLGVLCRVCGVLGHLAPVHRCARSVCCVACAVSWASWLLFTGAPARCVVLRVRCTGPLGSSSPVRPLGVLFCVCGVLGLLAPVHRCADSVCCVAVRGVAAGRSLVHQDGSYRSRQGLGTLRAHTRLSGRRLFVAGRGWGPSGRAHVHPDGGWRACACSLWPGRAGRPPGRVVVRLTFSFGRFVFLLCLAPSGLGWPPSLSLPLPFLVALALCFGCFSRPPAAWLFVRSRLVCVSRWAVGCSLVVSLPPLLPFCVSRFSSLLLGAWVFFFFFFLLLLPFLRPRCLRLPLVSGPGCPGPRRCALFASLAFRFSALCALVPLSCFLPGCTLLPGGCCPLPPFCLAVFVAAARCCVPCALLCRASLGAVLLRAAARCVFRCCAVLCCVALVGCRCLLRRALWRCPSPWGSVLCGAVFCGVPPRCVLCAVCVLLWRGGACCCSPLCFVLCVSRGAVLCVPCLLRSVRCCASLCWCARIVLFVWCVLLLAPGAVVCRGAVLSLVARRCLLVVCFGVGVPVWPRRLLPCGWCGLLWCPAFLCRVLWWSAVAWCCAVVLCCLVAVLLGLALPSCGLSCCAVLCCWLAVLFFARWWCLRAVVLFSSCCAFPVFSALCAAVPRCAGCGALLPCVLCCGAVLSCGAVLLCSAVVLRCCLCLLCPPAARLAAPVSSALLLVPRSVACPCALWCLPGRSAVWWCCSGVSWCLAVLCVVLWCPAPCAVSCGAVLPCGAVLVDCAVRLSALLVFVFPFVLFSFAKNPCRFFVPLKTS